MKTYRGRRREAGTSVTTRVDNPELGHQYVGGLRVRLDLSNHSPGGFEWGYLGSGPSQLALALLADCFGDDQEALRWYQDFKRDVVATWGEEWEITCKEIQDWLLKRLDF